MANEKNTLARANIKPKMMNNNTLRPIFKDTDFMNSKDSSYSISDDDSDNNLVVQKLQTKKKIIQ